MGRKSATENIEIHSVTSVLHRELGNYSRFFDSKPFLVLRM